ncbi:translocation/assembly module TamB domain-containing protein [Occallatibacter riparius]|uniref:Translocation/assembly module TamB domain-containing protein n=1 Tax=Occallatibacter riparius TaxID=1002689 RepID=A0A9J7BLG3_9BACT|nr:translocation/assembly module TamB domain-containing protein [Occallatibacter riparius]UWZ83487.1 translocation/assembly module TamB domain-containing protein [Occallatibacter riparius]
MSTARPLFQPEPPPDPNRNRQRPPLKVWQPSHRLRKVFAWISGITFLLTILIAVIVAVLLHSQKFHRYIITKVQSAAADSLGTRLDLQNFALSFNPLGLDIYGVTLHGAAPYPNIPVLQLQHAHVGVRIVSFLQRKWYLSDVQLDHPVVEVFVDKHGVSNIPKPKPSNSKSNTTIWDLGIRHTVLDKGEIYYNAQATPLSANLYNLDLRAAFDASRTVYSGELKYENGRIIFGTYQPFDHNLDAQFDASPTTFQLHRVQLTSNSVQANIVATATNFSSPHVDAKYEVDVNGGQLAKLLNSPSVPQGLIRATGSATYQQVANEPAMQNLVINGDLASKQLLVNSPQLRTPINNLSAHYSLAHGNAVLHDFSAGVLGGQVTAHGAMNGLGSDSPKNEMVATVHNVSLSEADRAALQRALPASMKQIAVSGTLNANAQATWGKNISDMVAKVDASVHGEAAGSPVLAATTVGPDGKPQPTQVPIDAEIHATYTGANQSIALNHSYVRTPQSTINLNGALGSHSSMALHLHFANLNEIAGIINMLNPPKPGQSGQPATAPLALAGSADFNGQLSGSTSAPHITGEFVAHDLQVMGSNWKLIRTGIDASPSQAKLINADLEPLPKGHIGLNASVGLHKWAFTKTSPLQVQLDGSQLDIASLTKVAGQQNLPVSGTLNTHLNLHGSEENPIGNGNLSITGANAYNEPINSVQVNFGGTGDQAKADLSIKLPAGSIQGNVSVRPKEKTYTAQLTSSGIDIQKLETVKAKNLDAAGTVAINASGQGTFDNPQLAASIQVPSLTIQKQQVANIKLDANVANHVATAVLTSAALNTNIQAKARVNLTGDYETDATLDTQNIPLQPIVALYSPANASTLSGATEVHATVHGPAKNKNLLEAHVTIPYLNVNYNNAIQLASAAPIHADYKNNVVTLQHSAIKGTDTNLEFEGSVPVDKGPMSLLLKGNVDLAIAQIFDPDVRTGGQIRFNIDSHGAVSAQDIGGEIDIVNASYASADTPVGLQNGNGVLKLTTDRINIQSFKGTVGGGEVTASGGVAYRPTVQFDLGMAAKGIRLLYPQGLREAIDANIHLAGTTENAVLGGNVDLTNISFTPAFDLTSFIGQFGGTAPAPPTVGGVTQNIHLNLAVRSTNNIALASRTLSVNGSANLQVRGTADNPAILGRVNLTGGDMILNNNRYILNGGTIQFVNPSETQPVVNVSVGTTIQQYNLTMRFQGPTDQMRTQYTSDPALPEADIIHLLAFGSTTEAADNAPAATPNQMAESLVANQVASQVTSRFAKVAGISQLSISPVLGNANGQQSGANITIQQRVTGNLFVTFSTNTADGTETVQGQYKISPKVSLSATRPPNGGFGVDALIKKKF